MAKNPKLVRERKVSILNPHKVEYYIKNPNTKTVTAKTFGHLALTKRIIGHALDRIRKHGIALVEWDSIEIDIDPAEAGKSNVTLDVHFINDGKVTHGLLGLEVDPVHEKMGAFEVIAVQPRF